MSTLLFLHYILFFYFMQVCLAMEAAHPDSFKPQLPQGYASAADQKAGPSDTCPDCCFISQPIYIIMLQVCLAMEAAHPDSVKPQLPRLLHFRAPFNTYFLYHF
jgi:hypothetical protein